MSLEEVKDQGITVTLSTREMENHLFYKIEVLCTKMKQGIYGFYPANPEISSKHSLSEYFNKLRIEFDEIEKGAILLYECVYKNPQFPTLHKEQHLDVGDGDAKWFTNERKMNEFLESDQQASERARRKKYDDYMNQFRY